MAIFYTKCSLDSSVIRKRFGAANVKRACPGWSHRTYSSFLPKHRVGNPGGNTELFSQHEDGSYSLVED